MTNVKIRNALVSVSDKTGLASLGVALSQFSVHVLSTGGTFKSLSETGVSLEEVSAYTGFPEMMDGRVKTLHPRVHGGLLGRLHSDGSGVDAAVMSEHGIKPIDLVVVNLYPFEQTVSLPDVTLADAIENIDIGGPALLRSGAKNFDRVAVVVDPSDYESIVAELSDHDGCLSLSTRFELAVKAFTHVAHYDVAIAEYLERTDIS
ncbi:MAG: bifunctional phosphoribosylaminoimidazolecarboxamide formyltransferase/IMP cyclohydrolase, partial [Pseudomonadales bacterium]